MRRREFMGMAAAAAAFSGAASAAGQAQNTGAVPEAISIDRQVSGQPNKGKVFALITPHLDDGPIFAGGLMAKLLSEGYTGYFIRTSNDEKDSFDLTLGETVLANERDTANFVKVAGLKKSYDLSYRNHRMDEVSKTELRGRLIFLFRLLKVDTVISYDPWGHYEENPDHYITAQAVEAACWMAAGKLDWPEHREVGLEPHGVSEKFYFARGPQLVNRVVDIGPFLQQKVAMIESAETMILHMLKDVNASLAKRGLTLPVFSGPNGPAVETFVREVFVPRDRGIGAKYKLEYAEEYHHIGPAPEMVDYIAKNARPL
jgi:LmbE family N-acetylglucosaminyl deacetylase